MEFRLLGPVEAQVGGTVVSLGPRQNRLVLAVLACEVNRLVPVERLVEWVWPVDPPRKAEHAIRVGVSRLRSRLAEAGVDGAEVSISTQGPGYVLRADPLRIDVHRFQSMIGEARSIVDDERKVRLLEQALGLWTGPALADTATDDVRDRLFGRFEEARLAAVEDRFACLLRMGRHHDILGELRAFAEAHPTREQAWAHLVLGLYRCDRQSDALAALRQVRTLLADELGIDPGAELRLLESRVLRQDPRLLLGESAPVGRPRPARPLSAFLGREAELRVLAKTLDNRRLATMVGPGGVGKTRLAVEYAADRPDPHGPWFVRLADVRQGEVVAHAVADAIGASDISTSTRDSVIRALASRAGLLVLDNCEHLVDAVAELVVELLDHCPNLRVLATSREPLGIDGEAVVPVLPLPVYEEDGTDGPAVRLLLDRISAARAGWSPSADDAVHMRQLCAALDGLPLALELAAAPATVLGLAEIVARLDDRFAVLASTPRGSLTSHANLQAAIAWSVEQLSADDRALLTRLWPFEGGFSLEAAEAVGPGDRTVESLSTLVSRSVVTADTTSTPTRYRLLETIRAYSQEQDPAPAATLEAHARWCRELVDQHWSDLPFAGGGHAMRVLTRELPNIRGCVAHDLDHAPRSALRTVGRLDWFWIRSGHFAEASRLLDAALAADREPSLDRVLALTARANLLLGLGVDPADAFARYAEAIAVASATDDFEHRVSHGRALFMSAFGLRAFGRLDQALDASRHTVEIGRELAVDWVTASGLGNLGATLVVLGRVAEGEAALVEAAKLAERDGVLWPLAYAQMTLGQSLLQRAAADPLELGRQALDLLCTAVHWLVQLEDQITTLAAVQSAAAAFAHVGAEHTALRLAAAVRQQCDDFGLPVGYLARWTAIAVEMPPIASRPVADEVLQWSEMVDLLAVEALGWTSSALEIRE